VSSLQAKFKLYETKYFPSVVCARRAPKINLDEVPVDLNPSDVERGEHLECGRSQINAIWATSWACIGYCRNNRSSLDYKKRVNR